MAEVKKALEGTKTFECISNCQVLSLGGKAFERGDRLVINMDNARKVTEAFKVKRAKANLPPAAREQLKNLQPFPMECFKEVVRRVPETVVVEEVEDVEEPETPGAPLSIS